MWWLYQQVKTQWRHGFFGPTGLDYNPAIAMINEMGWPLVTSIALLRTIEMTYLEALQKRTRNTPVDKRGQAG